MRDWAKEIEDDLRWREAELATFKLSIIESKEGSVKHSALLRANWAMLYAHYEGFSKFAWDLYLEALGELKIKRGNYINSIARLSLSKEFKKLRANLTYKELWDFCETKFEDLLNEDALFVDKLETQSNLWPNLFKDNSSTVNLPYLKMDEHESKIRALVHRRNEIAHGQKMVIKTLKEYQEYEDAAIIIMHELGVAIVESLEKQSYLKDVVPV